LKNPRGNTVFALDKWEAYILGLEHEAHVLGLGNEGQVLGLGF